MASSNLLYRRNPLAYPAGRAPGFNPGHVVGADVLFSSVAVVRNHINLIQGQVGAITGTVTTKLTSAGGLGTSIVVGATAGLRFDNIEPAVNKHITLDVMTMAAIFMVNGSGGATFNCLFNLDNNNSQGFGISLDATNLQMYSTGVGVQTVFAGLTVGTTYFAALSNYGNVAAPNSPAVLVNLDTGKTQTVIFNGVNYNPPTSGSGIYCVGNIGTAQPYAADATVHATMATARQMSMAELQAWAQDPWAFWYPQQTEMLVAASGVTTYAAFCIPQDAGRSNARMVGY